MEENGHNGIFFHYGTLFHKFYVSKENLVWSEGRAFLNLWNVIFLSCADVTFVDLTQPGYDSLLHSTDCSRAPPETGTNLELFFIRELQAFWNVLLLNKTQTHVS